MKLNGYFALIPRGIPLTDWALILNLKYGESKTNNKEALFENKTYFCGANGSSPSFDRRR